VKSSLLQRSSKVGPQLCHKNHGPLFDCITRMCVCVCVLWQCACRTIPVTYVLDVDDPITCVLPMPLMYSCSSFVYRAYLDRRRQYTYVHFSYDVTRA